MKATELFALAVQARLYCLFVIHFNDWERGFACLAVVFGGYFCSVAKFQ